MALTYVGGITGNRAGSTSVGITLSLTALTGGSGSTALTGDIVIAVVATGSTADRAIGIATPADFTEEQELYSDDAEDTNLSVSWKIMGATPDTSIVTSPSGSTADGIAAAVHVWRGVNQSTPFDVAEVPATGIDTGRPTPPAILPTTAGAIVICCGGGGAATGGTFTSSDLSNFRTDNGVDNNDGSVGIGSFAWTSGTFTPAQWGGGSNTASDSWAAVTLALKPAPDPITATSAMTVVPAVAAAGTESINTSSALAIVVAVVASATIINPVTATAAMTIAPTVVAAGTESLSGTAVLTIAPIVVGAASETISGAAALVVASTVVGAGTVTSGDVTSTAALIVVPSVAAVESETISGTSAMVVAPSVVSDGAETLSATGVLTLAPAVAGTGTQTGVGGVVECTAELIIPVTLAARNRVRPHHDPAIADHIRWHYLGGGLGD